MIGRSASDNGNGQSLPGGFLHEIEGRSLDPRQRRRSLPPLASSDERRSISGGRSRPKPSSSASSVSSSSSSPKRKEKKKAASLWGWNPIKKALSHITGQRRFDCCFSLHVHSIEGLPAALSGIPLVVHWRRASDPASNSISTSPARVVSGVVQFEETLTCRCAVQGARTGPGGTAKYEARHFLIYSSLAGGAPELDLGRHLVDVTRMLPATLEELEDEKAFGSWSTSYRLSGKAKGASLNVSFWFSLIRNEPSDGTGPLEWDNGDKKVDLFHSQSRLLEDVKVLHEVLTSSTIEISPAANVAAKFDTLNFDASADMLAPGMLPGPAKGSDERECSDPDCIMIEHGVVTASDHQTCQDNMEGLGVKLFKPDGEAKIEGPILELGNQYMAEAAFQDDPTKLQVTSQEEVVDTEPHESAMEGSFHSSRPIQESPLLDVDTAVESDNFQDGALLTVDGAAEDLNSIFQSLSALKRQEFDSPNCDYKPKKQLSHGDVDSSGKMAGLSRSSSLDAVTESVANEFLSVLGIEHSPLGLSADSEPESPREKLWKQFEKESLASGGDGIEQFSHCGDFYDDLDLSLMVYEAEKELEEINMAMNNSKYNVKMLDDAETEALMQEWGLNENNFNFSPPRNSGAFGSPIDLPTEEPLELPPLGEGLGPIVQTIDGGFLRSMSPFHFTNAKNKEKLIMQASSPVVLPAEMGSGIMEILQRLASGGIEKLSRQAGKLMPLEDITGKTMRQIAWDSVTALDSSCESHAINNHNPNAAQNVAARRKKSNSLVRSPSNGQEMVTQYVALEDLAPMAMDRIEALSIEGLRIQTGTSDEEAPSSVSAQSIGDASTLEGGGAKDSWSIGSESAGSDHDIHGLMGLSLSLNEWMKLDSGTIDEEDRASDRASKISAAHHANSATGGRSGKILRDDLTVALRVQLRDPLRNFEPVGTPMLTLIQVERALLHPKPKIYQNVNEREDGVETEAMQLVKGKHEGTVVPRFQVTEVHVAGLSTEPSKTTVWGDPKQQQSGSRWMFATGMGKARKHPSMEPKGEAEPSQGKAQPGDTVWSISSQLHGHVARRKGLASVQPHTRNPNVILPSEIRKLC